MSNLSLTSFKGPIKNPVPVAAKHIQKRPLLIRADPPLEQPRNRTKGRPLPHSTQERTEKRSFLGGHAGHSLVRSHDKHNFGLRNPDQAFDETPKRRKVCMTFAVPELREGTLRELTCRDSSPVVTSSDSAGPPKRAGDGCFCRPSVGLFPNRKMPKTVPQIGKVSTGGGGVTA